MRNGRVARPAARSYGVCLNGAECLFDPELHDGPADVVETLEQEAARVAVAKQVCASCPVLDVCLAYALRTRPTFGVWAGRTAGELAELAESPRAAAARARRGRAVA